MESNKYGQTLLSLLEQSLKVNVPVYGLSMFPTYLPGDVICIKKSLTGQLRVGDVVVFIVNDQLIAHRVIKVMHNGMQVVTKGDGMVKRDSILAAQDIVGVVVKHTRNKKEVSFINKQAIKKIMSFISPFMGVFFSLLGKIWFKLSYKS